MFLLSIVISGCRADYEKSTTVKSYYVNASFPILEIKPSLKEPF